MALATASDIELRYSNVNTNHSSSGTAGGGNIDNDSGYTPTTAANANTKCLGTWLSENKPASGVLNNLFDDVSASENAALNVEYRCVFVTNKSEVSGTDWPDVRVWIQSKIPGTADIDIAADTDRPPPIYLNIGTLSQAGKCGGSPPNEDTTPVRNDGSSMPLTWVRPTDRANALQLGNIPATECRPIWIRRTAKNGAAANNLGFTLRIEGGTAV